KNKPKDLLSRGAYYLSLTFISSRNIKRLEVFLLISTIEPSWLLPVIADKYLLTFREVFK
ncbi:MAG: hypothetical protein ACJAZI_001881, partial [Cycloclasticus sp.]